MSVFYIGSSRLMKLAIIAARKISSNSCRTCLVGVHLKRIGETTQEERISGGSGIVIWWSRLEITFAVAQQRLDNLYDAQYRKYQFMKAKIR